MSVKRYLRHIALALAFLSTGHLLAQTSPAPPKPQISVTAAMDGYYAYNPDQPAPGFNLDRNFDDQANQFTLNNATLSVERQGGVAGFRLDAGWGDLERTIHQADPWGGPNRHLPQAYVSLQPARNSALRVDAGKFFTSVGAESAYSQDNFNYSRSLLYVLGEPYYHFGVRTSVPVGRNLAVGLQLLHGWNNVMDPSGGRTLGLTASWTRGWLTWSQTYLAGPEKVAASRGFRQLYNSVVTMTAGRWLSAYGEWLNGAQRMPGGGGQRWYGAAGALRFTPRERWSFSPRFGWFDDRAGFCSGTPQRLMETTLTAEYRPAKLLISRLEYRRDWSDRPFFDCGQSRRQQTLLAALIVVWKKER
ncbi:MAG TPA: outer membrane beta-barrel protein [Bryobacteraceae bacterium]|nr:outer membrane beta-barrel protein [Bryobacteraceae bacterium]